MFCSSFLILSFKNLFNFKFLRPYYIFCFLLNFSFCYNKNIAFGYINSNIDKNNVKDNFFEIEVAKNKYKAHLELEPLHDPKNILIKS